MSTRIVVSCPSCQSEFNLKSRSSLGKRRDCPRCGESFVLRTTELPDEFSEFANSQSQRVSRRSSPKRSSQTKQRTAPLVAVIIAAVIGVSLTAYSLSRNGEEYQASDTGAGTTTRPSAESAAWYQWRGPKRDGVSTETGLLDKWPNGGPPLAWRVRGLGKGMSSVSIHGDYLFTMGHKHGKTHIICRNRHDGSDVWSTPIGEGEPNSTPTVDPESGLVFCLTKSGNLACNQSDSGKEVWSKNLGRDFGGRMMSGWGYSESPLVDGDHLICTPGAKNAMIVALDKKTGQTVWKSAQPAGVGRRGADGAGYSSIVVSNGAGVKQYVQLTGRGLISVTRARCIRRSSITSTNRCSTTFPAAVPVDT